MIRNFITMAVILIFVGCTAFQPKNRPLNPLEMPENFSQHSDDNSIPDQWWKSFGNAELNNLVEEALSGNFDIHTAWSRLKKANALLQQAGADIMPSLSYSGNAEKSWKQTKGDNTDSIRTNSKNFSAGLAASYEVDLWGRLNAQRQSQLLEYNAARDDLAAAAVTVTANVVSTWIDILSTRHQITILHEQIRINEALMKLENLRFINGKASALDFSQQREALAAAKAKLPPLQLAEQQKLNALAVLLGRSSAQGLSVAKQNLPELISVPSTGLPADLLVSRPDVRAAGQRLHSADWQVSAAKADLFPSISISANGTFSNDSFDLLFSNWVSILTASITGPLFDSGKRSAEVDRLRATAEEILTDYARTVAEAIQEVDDGLITEKRQNEYIKLLEDQLSASRLTLKDARLQYINGQDNYLSYLTAWTSVQTLERQLVQEQATLIKNRVDLYRAVGGDWTNKLTSRDTENS
ncbi:MAG: efflux transporter outer membrane subunit [Deltaproteobacteria bacterium]|nr:efflux transporter outer membrane subunit [Deltaproteobacteria bacterium]